MALIMHDDDDSLYASLGYDPPVAAADSSAAFPFGLHYAQPPQQQQHYALNEDATMQQAAPFDADNGGRGSMLKPEPVPSLLDPFGFGEAPSSPLPSHSHEHDMSINTHSIMHVKNEMEQTLSELDDAALPPHSSGTMMQSPPAVFAQPMKFESTTSNAHIPLRQNATPQFQSQPLQSEACVKQEPVSPSLSFASAAASGVSSPNSMPPLVAGEGVLTGGMRSGSSAGESGSAGSGGSGLNSVAQSCTSASDSDSDAAFDEGAVTPKRGAASKKVSPKSQSRKRKGKAGSGNSSSNEQLAAGDEVEDAASGQAAGEPPMELNKRQQRLQRNRASAQLSRERKKQYMKLLEKQIKELAELNEGLTVQLRALTAENTQLKTRLSSLSMRERVQARFPKVQPRNCDSASSQASTASMHSSPVASSPSDFSEPMSNPASPHSGASGEVDLPQAKRVKVQAYAGPLSPGAAAAASGSRASGAFNARAGMLLFTLVMSMCLLSQWAGVEVVQVNTFDLNSGLSSVPVNAGPAEPVRAVGQPGVASSHATLELMSEGGGGGTHRAHVPVVTRPARGRVLASLVDEAESDSINNDAFALVPLASSSAAMEVEDDSKALDVYTRRQGGSSSSSSSVSVLGGDDDGKLSSSSVHHLHGKPSTADVQLLRRLLLSAGGNSTSAPADGAHYMFCPHSMSIAHDTWTGLLHKHQLMTNMSSNSGTPSEIAEEKQLALFEAHSGGSKRTRTGKKKGGASRLRKVIGLPALPAPGSSNPERIELDASDAERAASSSLLLSDLAALPSVHSGLQVGDKLLLWVPLQLAGATSVPSFNEVNATMAEEAPDSAPKQGLVEIACSISHVRPIVLA